ncbi:hypothetical protein M3Y98_00869800 [Aphelenchoides besseyi]|nr:hypothetical protein M3Y98_00869800 [Aphelenchoides besseyi]
MNVNLKRPAFIGQNYVYTFSMDGLLPNLLQNTELFAGGKLNYLLIPEYIGCYFSVCYSCVPFIYRYLIICWDHHMNRLEFGFLCLILFCLSLFCSVVINYPSAEIYDYNMKLIPTPNPNCTRFLPQFGPSHNQAETKLLQVFQLWHYGTLFILATYLITIACFINIQIFLYQKRHNSDIQLKIQKQLTWTLGLQALCPLVFNGIIVFLLIAHYRSAFFTLASQMGHQILTSIRLQRYATSKPTTQPLFVQPAARPERNFEMVITFNDDFVDIDTKIKLNSSLRLKLQKLLDD